MIYGLRICIGRKYVEYRRKDIRILLTSVFITENHWIGSWLTVRILKSFFAYAQFVPEFKKMSQISSSSSSHKKRKYCVNNAIDFVSSVCRLASQFFFRTFSISLTLPLSLIPRSNAVYLSRKHYVRQRIRAPDSIYTEYVAI